MYVYTHKTHFDHIYHSFFPNPLTSSSLHASPNFMSSFNITLFYVLITVYYKIKRLEVPLMKVHNMKDQHKAGVIWAAILPLMSELCEA